MPPEVPLRSATGPIRVCTEHAPIGTGTFGRVYRGHDANCNPVAVKLVPHAKLGPSDVAAARREAAMMLAAGDHPHLLPLLQSGEDRKHLCIVTPLIGGGDLKAVFQRGVAYPEASARQLLRNLLSGIAHMHARGVMHRDIKLENILFPGGCGAAPTNPVLIDFGSAVNDTTSSCFAGSFHFAAPEVIESGSRHSTTRYDKKCDVWSFGVVAYMVLQAGTRPFSGRSEQECAMEVFMNKPPWDEPCSSGARAFVGHLLASDPNARPTAAEALQHAWLNADGDTASDGGDLSLATKLRCGAARINHDAAVAAGQAAASAMSASDMSDLFAPLPPDALLRAPGDAMQSTSSVHHHHPPGVSRSDLQSLMAEGGTSCTSQHGM